MVFCVLQQPPEDSSWYFLYFVLHFERDWFLEKEDPHLPFIGNAGVEVMRAMIASVKPALASRD